jgi:hypothetical protein
MDVPYSQKAAAKRTGCFNGSGGAAHRQGRTTRPVYYLRLDQFGERVPLTIADYDAARGTVTIIFQTVGRTTGMLGNLKEGDFILDFCRPFGKPTDIAGIRRAAVVGGGVGCAIAYPSAKALFQAGAEVDLIAGFPKPRPGHLGRGDARGQYEFLSYHGRRYLRRKRGS